MCTAPKSLTGSSQRLSLFIVALFSTKQNSELLGETNTNVVFFLLLNLR
jgi:hypothetical protein